MAAQRARRVAVPPDVPGTDPANADYISAFELRSDGYRRTPEQWARAVFEHAPAGVRLLLVLGWRLVLGLRMGPKEVAGYVLGWRIAETDSNVTTLESRSPILSARNCVVTTESTVLWVTQVRFERGIARPLWAVVSRAHHLLIPYLLGHADRARHLDRS